MDHAPGRGRYDGLPPLVGTHVFVVSHALERAHDRARGLEQIGYRVHPWGDPDTSRSSIADLDPEAIVIDLGREVGFPADLAARLREITAVPMVVVGCAGTYPEMLRCYEAGADDYCRPRCQTEEIDLRLRAIFRRIIAGPAPIAVVPQEAVHIGDLEIDRGAQVVRKRGDIVPLSPTEFRLLMTLAEHAGQVVPAKALIARVWGNQYASESHYLRLYVRYLRQKIEDDPSHPRYIVNRWGSGYALENPARAA
ncbi:MAG TPA: response regulator transcription factor [Tepidiformaceae bacterium]|nr:response regulator transcription factor [Tepidiformaceae bacterium]